MRKREIGWLLLIGSFIVACGSDKTDPVTKPKPIIETKTESDPTVAAIKIDFLIEEKAIKQTLVDQDAAISEKEVDDIMSFWIKREDRNVLPLGPSRGVGLKSTRAGEPCKTAGLASSGCVVARWQLMCRESKSTLVPAKQYYMASTSGSKMEN